MKLVNGPFDGKLIADPGGHRVRMTLQTPTVAENHLYAPAPDRSYAIYLGAKPVDKDEA